MASAGRTPEWTRALVLKKCAAKAKPVSHEKRPLRQLQHGEILVKISAASFNRRDVSVTLLVALAVAGFVAHPDSLIALDTPWSIPGA
jgi:NADPH:quinone reductase-like Zn-dependent oxidoreductase